MTKPRVKKRITTARSASMNPNGANIEKKEKMPSRNLEQLSQRKNTLTYL